MRVLIVGATGPLGIELIQQARARGHEVVALVRSPEKIQSLTDDKLILLHGNPLDQSELEKAMDGCEAVLSALGAMPSFRTITVCTSAATVITNAMKSKGIRKLVVCSAMYTTDNVEQPFAVRWLLKPLMLGRNMDDLRRMELYFEENCPSMGINYVVVKPPHLTNGARVNCTLLAEEGDFLKPYPKSTPRANVAEFMLDRLEDDLWDNKLVSVAVS